MVYSILYGMWYMTYKDPNMVFMLHGIEYMVYGARFVVDSNRLEYGRGTVYAGSLLL